MKKMMNRKGFTLAEMLIVMAVVVVLAAAAIPAIGNQVETAREGNDLAAIASAYVEAYTKAVMDYNDDGEITQTNGKYTISDVPIQQTVSGWNTSGLKVGGVAFTAAFKPTAGETGKVSLDFEFAGDATATPAVPFEYKGVTVTG